MRIVIAPDSFKGSATAVEAAHAIAEGWRSVRPDDHLTLAPMADGGEGTVDAVAAAVAHAEVRRTRVTGPDGREVTARWLLMPSGDGPRTALVELAEASGLLLLSSLAPFTAHTLGLGELLASALADGVERVFIGLGGSASTDGGTGALLGLGATFIDEHGARVSLGNAGLHRLARADLSTAIPPPSSGALILSDVDNPLLGRRGAVPVFGPQKGIDASCADRAEQALERLVAALGPEATAFADTPGAGAAGGTGFGLLAWGAEIAPGARAIAELIGLPAAIDSAELVITGEGRFDDQSAGGKVPVEVARVAAAAGVPCALVAGSIDAPSTEFVAAQELASIAPSVAAAIADSTTYLRLAGARLAELLA
jgi:glycerate kinase